MRSIAGSITLALMFSFATAGCNKQSAESPPSSAKHAPSASESSHGDSAHGSPAAANPHGGHEDAPGLAHAAAASGDALSLDGLTFTLPEGWQAGELGSGPFPPVAVYNLAKAEGDSEGVQVRITHFPGMKGKDEMNLQRWLGQVAKDDGSSYSMDEAQLVVREMGNVRLKVIDLSGNVKATMRATPRSGSRMIAAIVDHPKGPHFVVATGPKASVAHWSESINAFLNSGKFE